ncbi:hypothetical protein [Streptomyces palmae]|uniref:Uncharacterized protein n=1 Tax=Streptomyces palmae TaxID=1701085 RepID=A0A4Z0GU41_9ACTN|nr:hypothetical protein [Streptomyces palmae]TGB00953.1 hypothetical protein E4099_21395 [Streptomyces palmae]
MSSQPDSERLRRLFTDAAYDITPSPVPLAAIEKAGRSRRRRRTAALATTCAVLLAPLAALGIHLATPPSQATVRPAATPPAPRVVRPGERFEIWPGRQLWLTEEGVHWVAPDRSDRPASRASVLPDVRESLVTMHVAQVADRRYLYGYYTGAKDAAGVKVVAKQGPPITGTVVRLAGKPGWGAWFAGRPLPAGPPSTDAKDGKDFEDAVDFARGVTVMNSAGHPVNGLTSAEPLPRGPARRPGG